MSTDPTNTGAHAPKKRFLTKRRVGRTAAALVVLLGLAQLVPYGRSTQNPPVTRAAKFPDARAQQLMATSCNDCHSNLTKRWWATRIAPASWLAENDVRSGRRSLNFSEWNTAQPDVRELVEAVQSGSMPPFQYTLFHRNARLSDTQRTELVAGLERLYASDPPASVRPG